MNIFTRYRSPSRRLRSPACHASAGRGTGFRRLSDGWTIASSGDWASGNQAFHQYHADLSVHRSYAWTRSLICCQAVVPFVFRLQVRHQAQECSSEFLPASPGIRQGASWRTMLLFPSLFRSRLAIGPRNDPPSSSQLYWGYNKAPHGARCRRDGPGQTDISPAASAL